MPEVQGTTTRLKRGEWIGTELAFLRQNYRDKGAPFCARELNRPVSAVHAAAERNGIARNREEHSFRWTEAKDQVLRRGYESGEWGVVKRLAHTFGINPQEVSRRAGELGLSLRPDAKPWTPEELDFASAHQHLSHEYISRLMADRGWKRSGGAIQRALKKRAMSEADERFMPASHIASYLGVDPKVVLKWIHDGDLAAQKRNPGAGVSQTTLLIEGRELARFIVQNPLKVNHRKFDWPWVSDLLARYGSFGLIDGRTMIERVAALNRENRTPREIAEILDSTPNSVSVMLSRIRAQERRQAA